ncbi:type I methionyl aminopeptidase [Aeromicrobium sp. CF3.5]|uniref:type I methionyl aminopeptidase n=1 Tax=Aeromicrobium sp. CF3.5 TaxID=3373078 RepID=UPI003F4C9192
MTALNTPSVAAGAVSARRPVPASIDQPEYVGQIAPLPYRGPLVRPPEMIEAIRHASRVAAQALEAVGEAIAPGVTTDELDAMAHEFLIARDAYPSTLGYRDFPKSLCSSVNEVICHGIPDDRPLVDGDIVNIDITAYVGEVHGDTNRTFGVGTVDDESQLLIERTHEATLRAIRAVQPGRAINVIGRVIETYARRFGYGVVREFTGHGVGPAFHDGLVVPHFDDPTATTVMEPGMTFTIEPMLTIGGGTNWYQWDDGWTAVTSDHARTAQFEHTILVTRDGAEILTLP